jgi:SsrA-binding protein
VAEAKPRPRIAAQNRKARRDYLIHETFEAGIVLKGTEVKSLREGRAALADAYAAAKGGELFLYNANIPEYRGASRFNHEPRAARKLLLRKREIRRLLGQTERRGMTLVPLSLYFNPRGIAKVQLALAEGKTQVDKRETIKRRDWQRQRARLMREKG